MDGFATFDREHRVFFAPEQSALAAIDALFREGEHWASPWWGDAEFKEAEHPRDEEGKFTESGASQVKDLPEGKLPSHFNDFIARGDFELSARKMEKSQFQSHDKYTIEMRPKTPPGIKTVGKQGKEYQYDPELAEVIVLSPDDPEIRREIVDVKEDLPARLEEVLEDDPEMMYRGISSEEFDFIRDKGIVQSKGAYNLGPAQEGLTYWSSSVKQAGFYANGFQPPWMKATWNKPAYVVVAKRAASEDTRHVPGTGKDEIGVARAVDQDEVVEVWRGRAAWISVGEQDVTKYGEGDDAVYKEGSGSLTQTGVVWEKVPDDEMFDKYVRSAAQDALPAFDAAYARWLGDREFREEDVNRDPEGKFAEQAGAGEAEAAELAIPEKAAAPPPKPAKPKTKGPARVFVSPNVGDLSFEQAHAELRGKRQEVISEVSSAIDSRLKIRSQNTDVVGAWADGAENSLMITSTGDPAKARAAAIIKGAITDQKQVLVFTPGKGGDNVMTSFEVTGSLADIHGKLLQNGLAYHTLEPVEGGARVHVYVDDIDDDGNSPTVNAVAALTTDEGIGYQVTEGNGEFIGAPTDYRGSDAAIRARAQAEYERAISEIEAAGQCPECNLREIWDDARDHWNTATGQAAGLGLRGSQGHEALISSRRPMGVGALESDRYRRIDLDAMRASPKELFRRNMELLRDPHGYPNLRPSEVDGKSPDEIAEAAIAHAVANLKFLYQTAPKRLRNQAHEWYEGAHDLAQDQASKFDLPIQSAAGVFAALSPQMDWDKNVYFAQQLIDIYHNKKDEVWDKDPDSAMSRTAAQIWKEKDLPHIERIAGKSLAELTDPVDKAYWIRTYNEAHTTREYQRHSPTGKPLGLALKADGTPAAAGWGSVPAIENAIRALESGGDRAILSDAMGDMHKVRSFYNNILDPKSKNYDVTMDTHAVGAALLRPLSGADTAVMHSLGTSPQSEDVKPPNWQGAAKSKITGVKGTYPLWADAYRQAASDLGIEPRVLQSAVWEAKRQLFGGMGDKAKDQIEAAWHAYREGADLAVTQRRVMAIAKRDRARRRKARGKDSGRLTGAVDETAWHPGDPAELYRSGLGQGATRPVDGRGRGAIARGTAEHDWRSLDRAINAFFANDAGFTDLDPDLRAMAQRLHGAPSHMLRQLYAIQASRGDTAAFDAAHHWWFANDAEFKFKEEDVKRDEEGKFATQAKSGAAVVPRVAPLFPRALARYGIKLAHQDENGKQYYDTDDGEIGIEITPPTTAEGISTWKYYNLKTGIEREGDNAFDLFEEIEKTGRESGELPPDWQPPPDPGPPKWQPPSLEESLRKVPEGMREVLGMRRFEWQFEMQDGSVYFKDRGSNVIIVDPDTDQWRLLPLGETTVEGKGDDSLYDAIDAMLERQEKAATEKQQKIRSTTGRIVDDMGYDPRRIEFTDEDHPFELNGVTRYAAGSAHGSGFEKGLIRLYNKRIKPETVGGIVAHEVMHQKFRAIAKDDYEGEERGIVEWFDQRDKYATSEEISFVLGKSLTESHRANKEEFIRKFPTYAVLQPLYKGKNHDKLIKEDGVTDYSREYWERYSKDKGTYNFELAVNETLAEIANLNQMGEPLTVKKVWWDLYTTINRLYKERYWGGTGRIAEWPGFAEGADTAFDAAIAAFLNRVA